MREVSTDTPTQGRTPYEDRHTNWSDGITSEMQMSARQSEKEAKKSSFLVPARENMVLLTA